MASMIDHEMAPLIALCLTEVRAANVGWCGGSEKLNIDIGI